MRKQSGYEQYDPWYYTQQTPAAQTYSTPETQVFADYIQSDPSLGAKYQKLVDKTLSKTNDFDTAHNELVTRLHQDMWKAVKGLGEPYASLLLTSLDNVNWDEVATPFSGGPTGADAQPAQEGNPWDEPKAPGKDNPWDEEVVDKETEQTSQDEWKSKHTEDLEETYKDDQSKADLAYIDEFLEELGIDPNDAAFTHQ